MLTELTPAILDAGAKADLAGRLRLPDDIDADPALSAALDQALSAALCVVERAASRALFARRFRYSAAEWRDGVDLPIAPVNAILRVASIWWDLTTTEHDVSRFDLDSLGPWPKVVATSAAPHEFPSGRILIEFEAGYGPNWNDIPLELRAAVVAQAASVFRRDSIGEAPDQALCADAALLLAPFQVVRL